MWHFSIHYSLIVIENEDILVNVNDLIVFNMLIFRINGS